MKSYSIFQAPLSALAWRYRVLPWVAGWAFAGTVWAETTPAGVPSSAASPASEASPGPDLTAALLDYSDFAAPAYSLVTALDSRELQELSRSGALILAQNPGAGVSSQAAGAAPVALASISASQVNSFVTVQGTASSFRASNSDRAPNSFQLTDASGTRMRVAVWNDVLAQIDPAVRSAIEAGSAAITVRGRVADFRGNIELHLRNAADIQLQGAAGNAAAPAAASAQAAAAPAANTVALASITAAQVNSFVTVAGTPSSFRASNSDRAPNSFQLTDAAGTRMRVAVWNDVLAQIDPAVRSAIESGSGAVTLRGRVADFRGNVELHLRSAVDIRLGASAAPSAAAGTPPGVQAGAAVPSVQPATNLVPSAVTREMIGTRVTLTARVVSTRAPSGDRTPFNFRLGDPTPNSAGSLDMVFWNDVAQTIPAQHRAEPDQFIQVTGRIDEFRGNIQLRLMNASDIQVLPNAPNAGEQSQAETVRPKAISLAELGTIAENTIVTVEVTIQGSEEIPFGRKLSVTTKDADQATGTVLFYDTALSPDTKLSHGNSIKVLGRRVTLEGQPAIATLSPSEKLTIGI